MVVSGQLKVAECMRSRNKRRATIPRVRRVPATPQMAQKWLRWSVNAVALDVRSVACSTPRMRHRFRQRMSRVAAVALVAGLAVQAAAQQAGSRLPAQRMPNVPPMAVTIVLGGGESSAALQARAKTYFEKAGPRLGIALLVDVKVADDPEQQEKLNRWRAMVRAQKARNPQLPLAFPDDEHSAGFIGPMIVIGVANIQRYLRDEMLQQAYAVHLSQHGHASPPNIVGRANIGHPAVGKPPRGGPSSRADEQGRTFSDPVVILIGLAILALIWRTLRPGAEEPSKPRSQSEKSGVKAG